MADNVDVSPGAGKTIGTDEVSINGTTVQVQWVKLTESADGSGAELTKREDAAHTSGDPGFMLLAVRKDTAAALAGTDGDYIPLITDDDGKLWVNASATGAAEVAKDEGDSHAAGSTGALGLVVRRDVPSALGVGNGQYLPATTDRDGRLWVNASGAPVPVANGPEPLEVIGTVEVADAPASERTLDSMAVALQTDVLMHDLAPLQPKRAVIDHATAGDNTVVAAVTGKRIRVVSLFLVGSGAVTVRFESGASGTALTGQMVLPANGGLVLPFSPIGYFETAVGALLNLELSAGTSVDGGLTYIEVA